MKPEPDEIDEILARALTEFQIRVARRWDTPLERLEAMLPSAVDYAWRDQHEQACSVRDALSRAGYAIVLDEAQLLEKGGEVKLHD